LNPSWPHVPRPAAIQPPATDISFELVELVRPVAQSD